MKYASFQEEFCDILGFTGVISNNVNKVFGLCCLMTAGLSKDIR